ncbi:MAG: hypothetical protein H6727_01625 [Myxococcales bacterium]|nr:hypothetical protein [Myxococcales bacterium]
MLRSLRFFVLALSLLVPAGLFAETPPPTARREAPKPAPVATPKPAPAKAKAEAPAKAKEAKDAKKGQPKMELVNFAQNKRDPYWDRPYLLAAYFLAWLVYFFYMLTMRTRQRDVQEELARLQRELDALKKD